MPKDVNFCQSGEISPNLVTLGALDRAMTSLRVALSDFFAFNTIVIK